MRPVLDESAIVVELAASGAATGITWSAVDNIRLDAADSAQSVVQNLRVRFPSNFSENSGTNGMYNMRFWLQSSLNQNFTTWNYKLKTQATLASTDFGSTALTSPSLVPLVYQENENIDKTTYYVTAGNDIDTIGALQIQLAAAAGVGNYDTVNVDRSDPQIVFEYERQNGGYLDYEEPSANSDHLWNFSECDVYLNEQTSMADGSTITSRHLVGWCADEDFSMAMNKDTVEFLKGKPSARAVMFYSKIAAELSGKIASLDPWFFGKCMGLTPTVVNRKIVFTEINRQRSIPNLNMTFEWRTNAGHLVQLNFAKCKMYFDGAFAPGGNEIARQGFKLMPMVSPSTREVFKMTVSKAPIQRAIIDVRYGTTSA